MSKYISNIKNIKINYRNKKNKNIFQISNILKFIRNKEIIKIYIKFKECQNIYQILKILKNISNTEIAGIYFKYRKYWNIKISEYISNMYNINKYLKYIILIYISDINK